MSRTPQRCNGGSNGSQPPPNLFIKPVVSGNLDSRKVGLEYRAHLEWNVGIQISKKAEGRFTLRSQRFQRPDGIQPITATDLRVDFQRRSWVASNGRGSQNLLSSDEPLQQRRNTVPANQPKGFLQNGQAGSLHRLLTGAEFSKNV